MAAAAVVVPGSRHDAGSLFDSAFHKLCTGTDELFLRLLLVQWVGAVVAALLIAPFGRDGAVEYVHPHVWFSILLGGSLYFIPLVINRHSPGSTTSRHSIAVAQMLFSSLFIQISGGRIETHFHIFGSLAFIAIYRDWRLLVTATVIVGADHGVRGILWPQSVYGTLSSSVWVTIEHVAWVLVEDVFLFISCTRSVSEMQDIAEKRALLQKEIDDRTFAEVALIESEKAYRFLADSMPQIVWTNDSAGSADYFNQRWYDYTGLGFEESRNSAWNDVIHPDDLPECLKKWGYSCATGDPYEIEYRFRRDDGTYRWHLGRAIPMYGRDGNRVKWIGTATDIHDKKEWETKLTESHEDLERRVEERTRALAEANESKSQFLANMSHEIRTPLTSIIGFSESLLTDELSPTEQKESLQTVLRNGNHLLGVINDILDLSKIEAGKLETELLPVDLFELISDVGNLMQHRATEGGISFCYEYEYPLPKTITTDPLRLKQVLFNLIGNAIKFTKHGGVKVRIAYLQEQTQLSFAVNDTGIGLTPEQTGKLFQAFTQADASTTRQFGGTGLGLVISQQLAKMLQGTISVKSAHRAGSTFTLTTNVGATAANSLVYSLEPKISKSPAKPAVNPPIQGKILLVEDGPDNQFYISFLLKKLGLDVTVRENGAEGVQAAQCEPFDLIVMDMQMPVMDGYMATQILRQEGYSGPILALTANIMAKDKLRCLNAGCDKYLGKPLSRVDFQDTVRSMLLRSQKQASTDRSAQYILPMIDDADYLEVIHGFLDNLPNRVEEIEAALRAGQWEILERLSHQLRGASGIGYPALTPAAAGLETAASTKDNGPAQRAFEDLCEIVEKILKGRDHLSECVQP